MQNDLQAQLAAVKKNAILDAAIQTFATYGYQKATIKLIAKEAGMADGTIYNYFKNKEGILFGIIERLTQTETEELEAAHLNELPFSAFIQTFVADRMREVDADYDSYKALIPENSKYLQEF